MSWFSRPDYHAGSVTYTREALFLRLSGEVRYRDASIPSVALFHDRDYLVMRHDLAVQYAAAARRGLPIWRPEVCDCDDIEAIVRYHRIKYRQKVGLRTPEAMGGLDYFPRIRKDDESHRSTWALTDRGLWVVNIYDGSWSRAQDEIDEVIYPDA